ncbi:family 78 glycoside hydrolase catalytic domain [Blautia sp.]
MYAGRMKTEYLYEPIGIDYKKLRLFWNCVDGKKQTAYQIAAVSDKGELLWDSGKVKSASMQALYGGKDVPPATRVIWKVCLWDEKNVQGEWKEASFETGISAWEAKWITGDYKVDKNKRYPVDCFRKKFQAGDVVKARLYITACGLYEAAINGKKAGDFILAPGITDYKKRIQYQTYDVTALIQNGENEIAVQVADGWYRGSCGAWALKNQYGIQTKLLVQLELTGHDGSITRICSDESWDWSADGPIRFADNKDGEVVDARLTPQYGRKAKVTENRIIPTASDNVSVKEHETFSPKLLITPSGQRVLDFGQNIAGYVNFSLYANEGDRIKLRFGEMLDKQGEFTQQNIQCSNKKITTPLQQILYTCRQGQNQYKTKFAIFGFQYVLVETDMDIKEEDFTAIAVYSDMERTGYFKSSNTLLNKFFDCTVWSAKNNSCDLPTDCPTRERHGWTGDAQIFCSTASFLFDYMSFARKYLNDMYDWQKPNGKLPQIAPEGGTDFYMKSMDGSVGWADAGVIIPYELWKKYNDIEIVKKYLPGMRRYTAFMQKRCGKWYPTAKSTGLKGKEKRYLSNYGQAYGEWAEPEDIHHMTWKDCAVPHPEVATAYTAHVCILMSEMEQALGNNDQAQKYLAFAEECRHSYQALCEKKNFSLDTDRQARLVRPLAFHLLNKEQAKYAKNRLIQSLEAYGWRIGTGFLSTPLILDVLSEIDLSYAYRLLENEKMPGWLFMAKNGATTVWEAWEGKESVNGGIASLDHYSKGAVCRWLFDTMCGIHVAGENHFMIAPKPGGHIASAKADYTSVYGQVISEWKCKDGQTEYRISIPANCTAEIILPDGTQLMQESGSKIYSTKICN